MKTLEALAGNEITNTIREAIKIAKESNDECTFVFNGVNVVVASDSDPVLIYRDWSRSLSGKIAKGVSVGPHPREELSPMEIARDAEIDRERQRRAQEQQRESQMAEKTARDLLRGALSNAGPIELSDESGWNRAKEANRDPYGGRCLTFAEDWARLMQVRIANGETIAECADELSSLADYDGITGFMYGAAMNVLAHTWKHGDELRRWHNSRWQIGDEGDKANESGGVLNPAVLSVKN